MHRVLIGHQVFILTEIAIRLVEEPPMMEFQGIIMEIILPQIFLETKMFIPFPQIFGTFVLMYLLIMFALPVLI